MTLRTTLALLIIFLLALPACKDPQPSTSSEGKNTPTPSAGAGGQAVTGDATAAPSGDATAAPSGDATAAPSGDATAAPSGDATTAPTEGGGDAMKRAKDVVMMLKDGKHAGLRPMFSKEVSAALPDAQLAMIWPGLTAQVGAFQAVLGAREEKVGEVHVVYVTAEFEKMPMDFMVAFNAANEIAGLRMLPSTNSAALGARPQTPKGPFPYSQREVTYSNPTDDSTLAGTLTYPNEEGRHPVVLLITGSGAQDRDETIFGHKPFFVLADHLTRTGIAVLRVDDRGVGGSTGDTKNSTIQVHATDVEAGIAFLKMQPEIDPDRVGLIGHSEGGIIAAIVGSRSPDVKFIVSLAGTGLPGSEISALQIAAMLEDEGVSKEGIEAIVAEQNKVSKLVLEGASSAEIEAALKASMEVAKKHVPDSAKTTPEAIEAQIQQGLETLKNPWVRSFFETDPREYWKKIEVPALVMIGSKDFQVAAVPNLAAIRGAIEGGKNDAIRLETLEGLNHLFQKSETGMLDEYAKIEETINPAALEMITAWLTEQSAAK